MTDQYGVSPLMHAAMNGHILAVRKLIELGANVDYQQPLSGDTALHLAAQCGHTRTVEALIKGHASMGLENKDRKTAYEMAQDFGHGNNKVMKRLFHSEADSSPRDKRPDRDPADPRQPDCKPSGRVPKDRSLLPCRHLLDIFEKTGVYSLLDSGLGFSLLCVEASIDEMAQEAASTLGLTEPAQVSARLARMVADFDCKDEILRKEKRKVGDSPSRELLDRYVRWKEHNLARLHSLHWHCMRRRGQFHSHSLVSP